MTSAVRKSVLYEHFVNFYDSSSWRSLNEFGSRVDWFKNEKFLRDLEDDSVDTEILDEELRSLQEEDQSSCRGRTVRCLESNPLQIVLCVLVLVDAGIVVAEILLDLHAIRGQYTEAESTLMNCLSFLKSRYANDLTDYTGHDIDVILDILRHQYPGDESAVDLDQDNNHHKRHVIDAAYPERQRPTEGAADTPSTFEASAIRKRTRDRNLVGSGTEDDDDDDDAAPLLIRLLFAPSTSTGYDVSSEPASVAQLPSAQTSGAPDDRIRVNSMHGQPSDGAPAHGDRRRHRLRNRLRPEVGPSPPSRSRRDAGSDPNSGNGVDGVTSKDDVTYYKGYDANKAVDHAGNKTKTKTKTKLLLKIAHILHYISIAILGVFVIQVILKIIGMGADFFRKKMEVFDAVIIVASFVLDIVFLEGIGPGGLDKGAALVIIFLLWRLLRVINGIMVTAKQRQEFRIKLQKRARRRAEKKIEALEEEKHFKEKEIANLQALCEEKGATEQEINFCKPRKRNLAQKNTSAGLSSIASLSLGFTMSMHMSGGSSFMNNTVPGSLDNRRLSLLAPDAFPGLPMLMAPAGGSGKVGGSRRTSVTSRLPAESVTAPPGVQKASCPDGGVSRTSMECVIEDPVGEDVTSATASGSDVIERQPSAGDEDDDDEEEEEETEMSASSDRKQGGDVTSPAGSGSEAPRINGDAFRSRAGSDRSSRDTSSDPDISSVSSSPARDSNSDGGVKVAVPPRAAVVAMEIQNGPIAVATSPLEGCSLETSADHVTWYSRPAPEVDLDLNLNPDPSHDDTIGQLPERRPDTPSPVTSQRSGSEHSGSPTRTKEEDRRTPSLTSTSS